MLAALFRLLCLMALYLPCITYSSTLLLEESGNYVIGYQYRGGQQHQFAPNWRGGFDETSGVSFMSLGLLRGRRASLLHCPWRSGTGVAYQEMVVPVPNSKMVLLKGSTAMQERSLGKSDGATFRVFINGQKLLQRHQLTADWADFEIDLAPWAGKRVVFRFETDPGPDDRADFDYSLWGDRRIESDSSDGNEASFSWPVIESQDHSRLQSKAPETMVPWAYRNLSQVGSNCRAPNSVCLLASDSDTEISVDMGGDGFPALIWKRRAANGQWVELRSSSPLTLGWSVPAKLQSKTLERGENSIRVSLAYDLGAALRSLVKVDLRVVNRSLIMEIQGEGVSPDSLRSNGWDSEFQRKSVPVPFYSGHVDYLPRVGWFVNQFWDFGVSSASSLADGVAKYSPMTDGKKNAVRERLIWTAAPALEEVYPHLPNHKSPYREKMAKSVLLDAWGGSFSAIKKRLTELEPFDLEDCVLLIHDWQRSGYDNGLPAHVPANAGRGGDGALKQLIDQAKSQGCLVGLHENYADIYPNYEGFSKLDASVLPSGELQKAWFNKGMNVQSFALRPTSMLKFATAQGNEVVKRYETNMSFLDVHSSMPPWFHVDHRPTSDKSASFQQVRDNTIALWQLKRDLHNGPVLGEGAEHWYWSGWLDGVEAQPGAGWELGDGESVPMNIGFDLLKIQPLQINHGMGYYHRWSSKVNGSRAPSAAQLDAYRMQEIAFGHSAYLGATTWFDGKTLWLEQHLVPMVTRATAASPVKRIEHLVDGRWQSSSEAAKENAWSSARILYVNQTEVVVNASEHPLSFKGLTLPFSGWYVSAKGLLAWSAVDKSGIRSDYQESPDQIFANVRGEGKSVIDFPTISTDGSVVLKNTGDKWWAIKMPGSSSIYIALNTARLGEPDSVVCFRGESNVSAKIFRDDNVWGWEWPAGTSRCSWRGGLIGIH